MNHIRVTAKFAHNISTVNKDVGERENDGSRLIPCSVVEHPGVGGELPAHLDWIHLVQVSEASEPSASTE